MSFDGGVGRGWVVMYRVLGVLGVFRERLNYVRGIGVCLFFLEEVLFFWILEILRGWVGVFWDEKYLGVLMLDFLF